MGRVVVLGSLNVDVVTRVERHPRPGRPSSVRRPADSPVARAATRRWPRAEPVPRSSWSEGSEPTTLAPRTSSGCIATASAPRCRRRTGPPPALRSSPSTRRARTRSSSSPAPTAGRGGVGHGCRPRPRRRAALLARGARDLVARAARVADRAAPASSSTSRRMPSLPHDVMGMADPVIVNESEMRQLADSDLIPTSLLVTFGAAGARWDGEEVSGIPLHESESRGHGRCR